MSIRRQWNDALGRVKLATGLADETPESVEFTETLSLYDTAKEEFIALRLKADIFYKARNEMSIKTRDLCLRIDSLCDNAAFVGKCLRVLQALSASERASADEIDTLNAVFYTQIVKPIVELENLFKSCDAVLRIYDSSKLNYDVCCADFAKLQKKGVTGPKIEEVGLRTEAAKTELEEVRLNFETSFDTLKEKRDRTLYNSLLTYADNWEESLPSTDTKSKFMMLRNATNYTDEKDVVATDRLRTDSIPVPPSKTKTDSYQKQISLIEIERSDSPSDRQLSTSVKTKDGTANVFVNYSTSEPVEQDGIEETEIETDIETESDAELPDNWTRQQDEEGDTYYWNSLTEESSWVRPLFDGTFASDEEIDEDL